MHLPVRYLKSLDFWDFHKAALSKKQPALKDCVTGTVRRLCSVQTF